MMFTLTDEQAKHNLLARALARAIGTDSDCLLCMENLDLEPTTQAVQFAAEAAMTVLLAHDLGYSNEEIARKPRGPIEIKSKARRRIIQAARETSS